MKILVAIYWVQKTDLYQLTEDLNEEFLLVIYSKLLNKL